MASKGKVILDYHDSLLRESDVALLEGTNWLNDNLIAFWFEYLDKERYVECRDRLALLAPQVVQFLKLSSSDDARIMFADARLSEKQLILMPLNNCASPEYPGGTHWSLLVYAKKQGFRHYDSSMGSGNFTHAKKIAVVMGALLGIDKSTVEEADCVQQENGHDCGLHVVCNADALCCLAFGNATQGICEMASLARVRQTRKELKNLIYSLGQKSNQTSMN